MQLLITFRSFLYNATHCCYIMTSNKGKGWIDMFPGRLKKLRIEAKLTQQHMADFLGITRQGYAKYENAQSESDHETIKKLAKKFNVTTDYLLGHSDNPKEEIEPELEEFMKDLRVWYHNEPEAEKDLEVFRRIMQTYNKDKN